MLGRDINKKERLEQVLYHLNESLRITALLLYPFVPETSYKIWQQLGIKGKIEHMTIPQDTSWGRLEPGIKVNPGNSLFPRIEEDKKAFPVNNKNKENIEKGNRKEDIDFKYAR